MSEERNDPELIRDAGQGIMIRDKALHLGVGLGMGSPCDYIQTAHSISMEYDLDPVRFQILQHLLSKTPNIKKLEVLLKELKRRNNSEYPLASSACDEDKKEEEVLVVPKTEVTPSERTAGQRALDKVRGKS